MKKFLLAGTLAVSLALSSSAFAAVDYGEDESLEVSYDAGKVSVETDLSAYEGQMTIIILDNDDGTVLSEDILYIDQEEAAEDIFQDMGLLIKDNAEDLAPGTYYVKVGGENVANLLVATIIVSDDETGKDIEFIFGDVTGDNAANTNDAAAIMAKLIGGPASVGGLYAIGASIELKAGGTHIFGDVTGDNAANTNDAAAIMAKLIGGPANVGGLHTIGGDAKLTIVE